MFGGLAFLVNGNMAVSASGRGGLLLRVDPEDSETFLAEEHVEPFEMRGSSMHGWLRVDPGRPGQRRGSAALGGRRRGPRSSPAREVGATSEAKSDNSDRIVQPFGVPRTYPGTSRGAPELSDFDARVPARGNDFSGGIRNASPPAPPSVDHTPRGSVRPGHGLWRWTQPATGGCAAELLANADRPRRRRRRYGSRGPRRHRRPRCLARSQSQLRLSHLLSHDLRGAHRSHQGAAAPRQRASADLAGLRGDPPRSEQPVDLPARPADGRPAPRRVHGHAFQ